ncbi:hypothetical protein AAVH_36042, partial [Aphelenchoides avenae]
MSAESASQRHNGPLLLPKPEIGVVASSSPAATSSGAGPVTISAASMAGQQQKPFQVILPSTAGQQRIAAQPGQQRIIILKNSGGNAVTGVPINAVQQMGGAQQVYILQQPNGQGQQQQITFIPVITQAVSQPSTSQQQPQILQVGSHMQ